VVQGVAGWEVACRSNPTLTEPTEQGYIVRDERPGTPQRTEFTMKYAEQDRQPAVDPRSTQRRAARAVKSAALWSVQAGRPAR